MQNKMQLDELNTIRGGNKMKCAFCGRELKTSEQDQTVCNNCINSVEELTDGREEEEIDE